MTIKLLHSTPLWVASTAIRKCWASEAKSDTLDSMKQAGRLRGYDITGDKDKELIERIGNKNKHSSTLEHLNYSFDIDGISRACLQEVARHRHASISVKSTRYTLKELKDETSFLPDTEENYDRVSDYCVLTGSSDVNYSIIEALEKLSQQLKLKTTSNDELKYMLPEAYKTSLVWTVNARSLQNFLALRTSPSALWEIRDLANELYNKLPEEHKYLFIDSLYKDNICSYRSNLN